MHRWLSVVLALATLAVSASSCGAKGETKKDEAPVSEVKAAQPDYASLGFEKMDLTVSAREGFNDFAGTLTIMAPPGLEPTGHYPLLLASADFSVQILQDTYTAAEKLEEIESGGRTEMCESAKVVERGERFLIFEGDCMGEHGFHLRFDLDHIGDERQHSVCLSDGYTLTREQVEKVRVACASIQMQNGVASAE